MGGGGGRGELPNKGRYGCAGPGIRYFRGQFSPVIRFCELNFVRALGFWQLLTKNCVIFDKRVTKVTYLLKISNFGTLKFMKSLPVVRFSGTFLLGHWYFWENFARPRFCTRRTSVPTFIRKSPPPPPCGNGNIWSLFVFYLPRYLQKHIVIFFSVRFC